jgi:hypothetical protein
LAEAMTSGITKMPHSSSGMAARRTSGRFIAAAPAEDNLADKGNAGGKEGCVLDQEGAPSAEAGTGQA